jgi:hypothetical protein
VQPELAPPEGACTWFYEASYNQKISPLMVLQPGDNFTVFFDTGAKTSAETWNKNMSCQTTFWDRMRKRLDFVPGSYAFVLTGSFTDPHSDLPSTGTNTPAKHFFTATTNLSVAIDQAQIVFYAGLGGLLAWLVTTFRTAATLGEYVSIVQVSSGSSLSNSLLILRKIAGAILISVTVTVIASRLSATAFPVKVSVDDFWGALTVGFVSYFIGGKFIDKLSDITTTKPNTDEVQPPLMGSPQKRDI